MRFHPTALVFVLMLSCKACDEDVEPTLLASIDATTPTNFRIVPAVGTGTVAVPVQLVNDFGAPVTGGAVSVSVDGPSATPTTSTLTVDSWGYATLNVTTTGPETFLVTPTQSEDGATAGAPTSCWSVGGNLLPTGLMPAWPLDGVTDATFLATLTDGLILGYGPNAWFLGLEPNDQPQPILTLPEDIVQILPVQLDADGITDAVVRSEVYIALLRGRAAGGMGWMGGYEAQGGMSIFGVSVNDVNGDQVPDLAVGLTNQLETRIQILTGDGTGSFALTGEIPFQYLLTDVLLAHSDNDSMAEVNLLDSTARLIRYAAQEDGDALVWLETGSSGIETDLDIPTQFLGAADLTGAGLDELFVLGPSNAYGTQIARIYSLEGNTCVTSSQFTNASATIGDLSGEGLADLVFMEAGTLWYTAFNGLNDNGCPNLVKRSVSRFPSSGVIAASDMDGVDPLDVAVAGDGLRMYPGTAGSEAGQWVPGEVSWSSFSEDLAGPYDLMDRDEDGVLDALFGVTTDELGEWHLNAWQIRQEDDAGKPDLWLVTDLSLEGAPLDASRCGDAWYLLTEGSPTPLLMVYDIGDQGVLTERARTAIQASSVACGALDGGAVVGVADDGGTATLLDESLVVVSTTTVEGGVDLAVVDLDGDGAGTLTACATTGCHVLGADLDGDGADEVYSTARGVLSVKTAMSSASFAGGGDLSLADADGDGALDLLGFDDGVLWVWRNTGNGLAAAAGLHTREQAVHVEGGVTTWDTLVGPAFFADIDGDGAPELMLQDSGATDNEGYLFAAKAWD